MTGKTMTRSELCNLHEERRIMDGEFRLDSKVKFTVANVGPNQPTAVESIWRWRELATGDA